MALKLAVLLCTLLPVEAAVKVEKTPYKGWPNCYRITNDEVELIVTSDIGPRVMRYGFAGGQNLFWEEAKNLGKTGAKEWQMIGGHRIWHAPEAMPRTYAPDNSPVEVKVEGSGVRAIQPVEASTGIQKEIAVRLSDSGSAVEVRHRLTNRNPWPVELSPWALTMMAPGGVSVTGFPPRGKHPEVLAPTHPLVMWAFTDFTDPRWKITQKYLILRQDPKNADPEKAGHFNAATWGAYLLGSDLFIKRYRADPSKSYTDMGCSYETFTNADFLELETLGPLDKIEPGKSVEHVERWSLHRNVRVTEWSDAELDRVVLPLVGR
jgi:hypothetical protein